MTAIRSSLKFALAAVLLAAAAAQAQSPLEILSRSIVFKHPHADPYDRANRYGFNHGPSVTLLPDGRLRVLGSPGRSRPLWIK